MAAPLHQRLPGQVEGVCPSLGRLQWLVPASELAGVNAACRCWPVQTHHHPPSPYAKGCRVVVEAAGVLPQVPPQLQWAVQAGEGGCEESLPPPQVLHGGRPAGDSGLQLAGPLPKRVRVQKGHKYENKMASYSSRGHRASVSDSGKEAQGHAKPTTQVHKTTYLPRLPEEGLCERTPPHPTLCPGSLKRSGGKGEQGWWTHSSPTNLAWPLGREG